EQLLLRRRRAVRRVLDAGAGGFGAAAVSTGGLCRGTCIRRRPRRLPHGRGCAFFLRRCLCRRADLSRDLYRARADLSLAGHPARRKGAGELARRGRRAAFEPGPTVRRTMEKSVLTRQRSSTQGLPANGRRIVCV